MRDSSPEKLVRQGKIEEAIRIYERALRKKPRDEYLMRKLGELYERAGLKDEAIRMFTRLGNFYLEREFLKKALAIFKKVYMLEPQNPDHSLTLADLYVKLGLLVNAKNLLIHLGETLIRKQNYKKAIEVYERLASIVPDDPKVKEALLNLYLNQGEKDNGVELLLNLAEREIQEGKIEKALARLKRAMILQPENLRTLELAKRLSASTGSDFFEQLALPLLKKRPTPELKRILAEYYLDFQNLKKARALLEELLAENPEDKETKRKLAHIFLIQGEFDRAFELLQPIANELIKAGEEEEAVEVLNPILKANPNHAKTLEKIAQIYERSGKKHNEIAVLTTLAEIYEGTGKRENLIETLKRLLSLDPGNVYFQEKFAMLTGEEEESPEEFIKMHMEEAENYMKLQLWMKAEAEIENILLRYPDYWPARLKLLEIYIRKGDKKATKRLADSIRMEIRDTEKLSQLDALLSSLATVSKEPEEELEEIQELNEDLLLEEEQLLEAQETVLDMEVAESETLGEKKAESEALEEKKADTNVDMEMGLEIPLESSPDIDTNVDLEGPSVSEEKETQREWEAFLEEPAQADKEMPGGDREKPSIDAQLEEILKEFGISKPEKSSSQKKVEEVSQEELVDIAKAITQELEAMDFLGEEEIKESSREDMELIKQLSSSMSASIEEEDYQTHFDLGVAYFKMGMFDEALAEFQISAKSPEKKLESLELMGICLFEKGLYEQAIETFKRGLDEEGYSPEKYLGLKYHLAKVYEVLGNQEEARGLLDEIKRVDPDYIDKVEKFSDFLH